MQHRELLEHRRQRRIELLEILKRKHLARDLSENRRNTMLLVKEIGAKPRNVRNFIAEIPVLRLFELFKLKLRRDLIEHLFQLIALQRRLVHTLTLAIDA